MKVFVLRAFVLNALRRASYRYPPRYETMKEARIERGWYQCAKCLKPARRKEVQIDHIKPVLDPATGFVDYNTYIERLFCEKSNLQLLCKPCHKEKSTAENRNRRKKRTKK
jgi:5-methylcytosine-specific restriction endonuclease McrA